MGRRFLLLAGKWEGVIPYLLPRFRSPNASTYRGTLASILVRSEECALSFAVEAAQEARSSGSRSGSRFFQLVLIRIRNSWASAATVDGSGLLTSLVINWGLELPIPLIS